MLELPVLLNQLSEVVLSNSWHIRLQPDCDHSQTALLKALAHHPEPLRTITRWRRHCSKIWSCDSAVCFAIKAVNSASGWRRLWLRLNQRHSALPPLKSNDRDSKFHLYFQWTKLLKSPGYISRALCRPRTPRARSANRIRCFPSDFAMPGSSPNLVAGLPLSRHLSVANDGYNYEDAGSAPEDTPTDVAPLKRRLARSQTENLDDFEILLPRAESQKVQPAYFESVFSADRGCLESWCLGV